MTNAARNVGVVDRVDASCGTATVRQRLQFVSGADTYPPAAGVARQGVDRS